MVTYSETLYSTISITTFTFFHNQVRTWIEVSVGTSGAECNVGWSVSEQLQLHVCYR